MPAFDPIIKDPTLPELFTEIANAIRSKTGSTDLIVARDFPSEIEQIEIGGPVKVYPSIEAMNAVLPAVGDVSLVYDETTKTNHGLYEFKEVNNISLPSLIEGEAAYTVDKEKLYRTIENVLDNPTADAVKSNHLMVFITTSNKCCILDTAKCANAGIVYRYDDHEEVHVGITELTSSAEQPAYTIYELDLENETLGSVLSSGDMTFRDRYNAQGITAGYHSWVTDSNATPITMGVRLKYANHNVSEDELTNTLYYADSPERTQVIHTVIESGFKNVEIPRT